jgi:CO dehydrogenase maturation factor
MKLGVVGKGGVGKTTVAGLIARAYRDHGRQVIAIDTDSNPNLGMSLGLTLAETDAVPVLPRAVIVGTGGDRSAAELIDQYGVTTPAGVTLLSAIRVAEAGAGCTCSGHATVRTLLGEVMTDLADVTLVDMEAGLEHLSRSGGTLAYADVLLVVMEPSRKSVLTAVRTKALADELGIAHVLGVGNKARSAEDRRFLEEACSAEGIALVGVLPHEEGVAEVDRAGGVVAVSETARQTIDEIVASVDAAVSAVAARQPAP